MRTLIDYVAVEVGKRDGSGNLVEWFMQGIHSTEKEAWDHIAGLSHMYPKTAYTVVERWITELEEKGKG